jgi:hypothetical protein
MAMRQLTGRYYQSKYIGRKDNLALRNFWYWYHNAIKIHGLLILDEAFVLSRRTLPACHSILHDV